MPKILINADEVKDLTTAQLSVEPHKLEAHFEEAQQRWLRPKLGTPLYEQLLAYQLPEEKEEDPLPQLAVLAAQVKPMLAAWVVIQAWPDLLVHITNAGVVLKTGSQNGTTSADAALVGMVYQSHKGTAEWRTGELVRWLAKHQADYSAWIKPAPPATAALPIGGVFLD